MVNALTGVGPNGGGSPTPVTPGTIPGATAFWNFNDLASLTVVGGRISSATDTVGGHNAIQSTAANRPTSVTGGGFNNNNYATFSVGSGDNMIVSTPFACFGNNAASIAARVSAPPQINKAICAFGDGAVNPTWYMASGNSDQTSLRALITDEIQPAVVVESASIAFSVIPVWRTLVFTWDGSTLLLYIDSTTPDANSASDPTVALGTTNSVVLGARDISSPNNVFEGDCEYIAMYNRALTSGDIANLLAYLA